MRKPLSLLLCLASASAVASGFYFGDSGSKALAQGGAFVAQADDLSAMQYNPAGLAQLRGLHFLLDGSLTSHTATFLRQDPGFDPGAPSKLSREVSNSAGPFAAPMVGVSYGIAIGQRTLSFALGVYGPPAVGRYQFSEPNYGKDAMGNWVEDPRRYAPQRYTVINSDFLIYYPTLSVAMNLHPTFSVGVSLQLVGSHFMFRQAIFAGDAIGLNPQRQIDENPIWDALAKVDLNGRVGFTGILGLLYKPASWAAIGASIRPPIPIRASGTLDLALTDSLKELGASVAGNQADFALTLPLELRVGARFTPVKGLGINADFVYMGWQSVDAFYLTPKDVTLSATPGSMPTAVAPIRIPRNFRGTFSGRVGASYDVIKYLTVHAGFLYETSATADENLAVDFAHPSRAIITGGLSGHFGPIDIVATFAGSPPVVKELTASDVRRIQSAPSDTAGIVGAGVLGSGGYVVSAGVRGHFLQ